MSLKRNSHKAPAPVALFVYNRADILAKTLGALRENTQAEDTTLYIFSDGPKRGSPSDIAYVQDVREIISSVDGFDRVHVVCQETNIGLANSVISGVTKVVNEHGRVIVLEDDLLTSKYFLTYMNDALDHYEGHSDVYCINGMSLGPKIAEPATADTYFLYRNASHGWATWADRWAMAEWDTSLINFELTNLYNQLRFNRGGDDMSEMMQAQFKGNIDTWDTMWSYAISRRDGRCLSPVQSYVTHQASDRGTHIKSYVASLDHDLSLAIERPTYPATTDINPIIARNFAKYFRKTVPFLLQDESEQHEQPDLANYVEEEERARTALSNSGEKSPSIALLARTTAGGAGIAVETLHRALLAAGANSHLIVSDNSKPVPRQFSLSKPECKTASDIVKKFITDTYVADDSTLLVVNTSSVEPASLKLLSRFDVINIHWIAGFLSLVDIAAILDMGKPVVWTMHDRAALTGGCHAFHGCENWLSHCQDCPQLRGDKRAYPSLAFKFKERYLDRKNLTLLALCRASADIVRRSPLFPSAGLATIHGTVDVETFRPTDSTEARRKLDIDPDAFVIFYSATYASPLKGFSDVEKLVERFADSSRKFLLLVVGGAADKLDVDETFCRKIGFVSDRDELRQLYVASDVVLVPSQDEGLPNVAIEGISCGTPVVGYSVGVVPELASVDGVATAVPIGDVAGLYEALCTTRPKSDGPNACREIALERFSPSVIADHYLDLFQRLLAEPAVVDAKPRAATPPADSVLNAAIHSFTAEALSALSAKELMQREVTKKLRDRVASLQGKLASQREVSANMREKWENMRGTLSWKVTRPLRLAQHVRRKLRKRRSDQQHERKA